MVSRFPSFIILAAAVCVSCAAKGPPAGEAQLYNVQFSICDTAKRHTCVVDGDTFWLEGLKVRIADIDTPEVSQSQCEAERELGRRATLRLRELLNAGPFVLQATGGRDADQYGRLLRSPMRNGQRLGDQLIREGLAREWKGRKAVWC